jgi:hypothetical protein
MILSSGKGTCRVEHRKGESRTVRTRRPLLAGTSYVCTLLVFLLFSFPNYCDNCAYRNITLYAYSMAPERTPSGSSCSVPPAENPDSRPACCGGTGRETPGGTPSPDNGGSASLRHVRTPYCLSYTISSIAGSTDLPEAVRGDLASAPLRMIDPEFGRLSVVLDHKESRAPPA